MADLETFDISLPGGINQSAPEPTEQDLEELENFAIFRGRIGLRAPLVDVLVGQSPATIQTDVATDVDEIIDIQDHEGLLYILSWSLAQTDVYLHSMQVDGTNLTLRATVYTSVVAVPTLSMTSFTGGTAAAGVSRLYIADYDQNLNTVFWNGSSIVTLTEDLDSNSSAEDIKFSLMIDFKFHLWGTGFFEGTVTRPEMIRFTQPGAIPATDEAGGTNPKEWFAADHRSVGRRGDKIVAVSKAGDRMLLFQKRAVHAIYGSGFQTWTRQELSDIIGCVGPYAVASVDDRVAYFWASDGPYRTDGNTIQYLGDPIIQLVTEVDVAEAKTQVGYSPNDGLVYYILSLGGADEYSLSLVFDVRNERWLKSHWLTTATTRVEFGALEFLDSAAAPGPEGAPSSPTATATSDTTIDVDWVNGDVNVDTKTHVYRGLTSGFTPNDATNRIATLDPGVTTFTDTGRTTVVEYFYKFRHIRNTIHSSQPSVVSDTTWLAAPTALGLSGLSQGLKFTGTNNASGADIRVQRKTTGSFANLVLLSNPGATFSHSDTPLTCGLVHHYRARAEKAGETDSEWSAEPNQNREACNAVTIPTVPNTLVATANGENQIDLTWVDASDDEDAFDIHRSTDGGITYSFLVQKTAGVQAHSDTGLTSNIEFFYKVLARNAAGPSVFTAADNATTDANLTKATLTLTVVSASEITLDWNDDAADEDNWEVHRSDDGGSTFTQLFTPGLAEGSITFADTGLSQNDTFHYKIRATGGLQSQFGPFSDVKNATTNAIAAPTPPTIGTVVKNGGSPTTAIDIIWTDNSSDETNFEVWRKAEAGAFVLASTQAASPFADTGLEVGTLYTYKVRAINEGPTPTLYSQFSAEGSDTTDSVAVAPGIPTGLAGIPDDKDRDLPSLPGPGIEVRAVDLTWTLVAPLNEETVEVSWCPGDACTIFLTVATLPAGTMSWRHNNAQDADGVTTTNRYRVRAINPGFPDIGGARYSSIINTTVQARVTVFGLTVTDTGFCDVPGTSVPRPRLQFSWQVGSDTAGLVTRKVFRLVGFAPSFVLVKTFTTSDFPVFTYIDNDILASETYSYRIEDDYGQEGENQGTFTSGNSPSLVAGLPDCSLGDV